MPVEVFTTMRTANNTQFELNDQRGGVERRFETIPARAYATSTY